MCATWTGSRVAPGRQGRSLFISICNFRGFCQKKNNCSAAPHLLRSLAALAYLSSACLCAIVHFADLFRASAALRNSYFFLVWCNSVAKTNSYSKKRMERGSDGPGFFSDQQKNAAWLEVKIGGSRCRIGAMAGWRLNSWSRNLRISLRDQLFGCSKSVYRERSPP